jgi:hypothetical protein
LDYLVFDHRFAAAFLAISFRRFGDSAAALAFPPLGPPSFPIATAAGFFAGPAGSAGAVPVAISTIILASLLGSRGIFERLSMVRRLHTPTLLSTEIDVC